MDVDQYMADLGRAARAASRRVAASSTATRNKALLATRDALDGARARLAEANAVIWREERPVAWRRR